jgi:hypothetical protein
MSRSNLAASSNTPTMANGSGAAAILSAGVGAFALAALATAGDKSPHIARSLIFYKPTGPLSGVTTVAISIWLFTWGLWNGAGATGRYLRGLSVSLRWSC